MAGGGSCRTIDDHNLDEDEDEDEEDRPLRVDRRPARTSGRGRDRGPSGLALAERALAAAAAAPPAVRGAIAARDAAEREGAVAAAMAAAVLKAHHRVVHAQARSDWGGPRGAAQEGGACVHELMF